MLSGVFHMLSALYIWFVLFDLRYLVLRVHHEQFMTPNFVLFVFCPAHQTENTLKKTQRVN